jgi:hypothetical protein
LYAAYLAEHEPGLTLRLDTQAGLATITGDVTVNVGAGVRRQYTIELRFESLDPFHPPEVWDRGGHFPPDGERHVEDHGMRGWRWCLWLPQAPEVDFTSPEPLGPFLEKVRGFISKQLIYQDRVRRGVPKTQAWPGSAWAHGQQGHVQWIKEQLGPLGPAELRQLLPYLLGNRLSYNNAALADPARRPAAVTGMRPNESGRRCVFRSFTRRWKTSATEQAASPPPTITPAEFAWRTHSAITDWTAKVDAKASIVLALESAIMGAVITLSGRDRPLSALRGRPLGTYRLGILLMAIGIALAGLVVFPYLDRRKARVQWRSEAIYFGHLRRWRPSELADYLSALSARTQLDILSRQLVTTPKIAWIKHARLQWSMLAAALGTLLFAIAGWYG